MKTKKIKNKIELFLTNKIVIACTLIFLVILWIGGSLVLNDKFSFSVLNYTYDNKLDSDLTLSKGQILKGEFKSKDKFLGIVYITFNDFVKPDSRGEDVIQFRIKKKEDKDWYYLNNYRSGLLKDNLRFPFGFPPIFDSKDKIHVFEVVSLYGNPTNSVTIGKSKSYLGSGHQYSKDEIFGSKKRIIKFAVLKFTNSFTNIEFIYSSVIFALPLTFYLFWILLFFKKRNLGRPLLLIVLISILIDIFLIKVFFLGIFLTVLTGWLICIKLYKLESSVSFFMAFVAISIWMIFNLFNVNYYSVKLNIWSYTFLFIGVIQTLIELKYKIKNREDYKQFINSFNFLNE